MSSKYEQRTNRHFELRSKSELRTCCELRQEAGALFPGRQQRVIERLELRLDLRALGIVSDARRIRRKDRASDGDRIPGSGDREHVTRVDHFAAEGRRDLLIAPFDGENCRTGRAAQV